MENNRFIDIKINGVNVKYLSDGSGISAETYERISKTLSKSQHTDMAKNALILYVINFALFFLGVILINLL